MFVQDDEAMFFVPTIQSFQAAGHALFVLCMSNGNYEGLGRVREDELKASCAKLGIPASHVTIVDKPQLQDGPLNDWPSDIVGSEVRDRRGLSMTNRPHAPTVTNTGLDHSPTAAACSRRENSGLC